MTGSLSEMDAYRDAFLAESADYLQSVTDGLLALESDPSAREPIETVFRGAHSLKGMAAAMGYTRTADLTHSMENLMDHVRRGDIAAERDVVNLMLAAVDLLKDLIADESGGGTDIEPGEMVEALAAAGAVSDAAGGEPASSPLVDLAVAAAGRPVWRLRVTLESTCVLKAVRAYMVIKRLAHVGEVLDTVPSTQEIEDERFDFTFEVLVASDASEDALKESAVEVTEVESAEAERVDIEVVDVSAQAAAMPAQDNSRSRTIPKLSETQTVRVAIGHLDALVDLVGELVILRSRLEGISKQIGDRALLEVVDEYQRISKDLQYEVLLTRMVPVGNIFKRFPRMVRDLAQDLGKQVDFSLEGLDIELDRTVLDDIGDPLVHLLRNSIDHGIEPVVERRAAGKPEIGAITLSARRERDHIAIVVRDDGRGIDVERVWHKAVECGAVDASRRDEYDDTDILLLTCASGFSTAEVATKISGRGVGMDVVKGKIEHLGGTLSIRTQVGVGSEFELRLPPTLAIISVLLVSVRGEVYALPLASVDEACGVAEATLDTIGGAPVFVHRSGEVHPVLRLDALLHGGERNAPLEPDTNIVLVKVPEGMRALHVDRLLGRHEIVVKPLSGLFSGHRGFSGATILGDGRVILILDPRTAFEWTEDGS